MYWQVARVVSPSWVDDNYCGFTACSKVFTTTALHPLPYDFSSIWILRLPAMTMYADIDLSFLKRSSSAFLLPVRCHSVHTLICVAPTIRRLLNYCSFHDRIGSRPAAPTEVDALSFSRGLNSARYFYLKWTRSAGISCRNNSKINLKCKFVLKKLLIRYSSTMFWKNIIYALDH